METTTHEPHGRCERCHNAAHRYPFGWAHVNTGVYACANLTPVVTCCDTHKQEGTK